MTVHVDDIAVPFFPATAAEPPQRTRQIEAEQVALLYAQSMRSQLATVINAGLVTLVLWGAAPHGALVSWAVLMAVLASVRSLLVVAYRRASPAETDVAFWRALFIAGTFCGGMGWCVAAVVLFPTVSLIHQVFIAFVLGGMAVGAAAVMSPVLASYWAFLLPFTLPVMVQLLWRGDAMSIAMGIMFAACTGMFLSAARQMHDTITDSIRLRFENLDLVRSLSFAKEQAETANESLQVEIGERTRAEARVNASLQEKEALLTEIHHRVKNNLQVISSLLSLQSRSLTNPEALSVFTQSQSRVRSMALVHEKLYQSPDLARIDFAAYVRELASYLCRVYQNGTEAIPLRINAQGVFLSIERAVPCGLIVTELLSNALKYAFPEGRRGEIHVDLGPEEGDVCRMTIRDNGVGLPRGVDLEHTPSLGLRIVRTLTEQLGGRITVLNEAGAAFALVFPMEDGEDGARGQRATDPHPGR